MKIGVIGDYILDVYVHGKLDRISPESPTPIFTYLKREVREGGAGNVVSNLKALGSSVEFHHDLSHSTKTRYVCDNHILFRVDDDIISTNKKTEYLFDTDVNYVILSDYNKGYISKPSEIIKKLKDQGKTVIVDPKKPLAEYTGASIIKLNEKEYEQYVGELDYITAARLYVSDALIITRASKSVIIATHENISEVSTENHQVSDVTGAGDVFIAAMTHYLSVGNDLISSIQKANKLATLSVTKFGTYVLSEEDISSIKSRVVFTNGCFDIIHRGHIEYLKASRKLGDKLVVAINSDLSVRRLKGLSRPFTKQEDRKAILESFSFVDEVVIFDEDTPIETIRQIKPSIITKGGDYVIDKVVGNELAEVRIIPYVQGYSTTNIMENK